MASPPVIENCRVASTRDPIRLLLVALQVRVRFRLASSSPLAIPLPLPSPFASDSHRVTPVEAKDRRSSRHAAAVLCSPDSTRTVPLSRLSPLSPLFSSHSSSRLMSRRPDSDVEEEDALSNSDDGGSSLASDGAATSGDPKKVSKGARAMHSLRNLLRSKSAKDAEKKKIAQARLESAKTSGDATPNGVIGASSSPPPLRSTASSSGLLSPGIRIEAPNASSASPEADSEPESVSPSSASSSGGSSLAPSASRRSVYAQKLIHFSNSFRSLFLPSIGANGQTGPGRNGVTGFSSHPHHFTNSPAWILGKVYKLLGDQQQAQIAAAAAAGAPSASVSASSAALLTRRRRFLSDYHTRVWMTYRRGFQNIGSSSYASDAGWGCMIRSAQMMLAHMLITHYLGREWRKPEREDDVSDLEGAPVNVEAEPAGGAASLSKNRSCDVSFAGRSPSPSPSPRPEAPLPPLPAAYLRILYLFLDSPSPACPYSIHNLLLVGGAAGSSASASASATAAKGKGSSASSTAASSSAAGFASRIGEVSWLLRLCLSSCVPVLFADAHV